MAYPHETESSLSGLFYTLADKYGNSVFMSAKFKNGEPVKKWVTVSWREAAESARYLGAGLISMGIGKNDAVGIFSNNRPRWVISDQAIQGAGAIGVPIYPTSTDSQLEFILNDSKTKAIVTGDQGLLEQVQRIRANVPELKFIVTMGPFNKDGDPDVFTYDEMISKGQYDHDAIAEFEKRRKVLTENDIAAIIYTSGTTGNPKGVVLTHQNFMSQTRVVLKNPVTNGILERGIRLRCLCHLPLCHILARAADYHVQMTLGSTICFAESMKTVQKNLLEIRPQFIASVPRLYEKIYDGVNQYSTKLTGIKKHLFDWAINVGRNASEYMIKGEHMPVPVSLKFALANILVYRHIRRHTGLDRLVSAVSGGGPLSADIIRFFRSMNIIIAEGYGLTETTASITWNGPRFIDPLPDTPKYKKVLEWLIDTMVVMQSQGISPFTRFTGFLKVAAVSKLLLPRMIIKPGYVGRPLEETDMKIAEDGEILVKGPQVFPVGSGYFNQPDKTGEVFTEDGYFKTGDIGEFDTDGFLKITDRKKELIVTSGGKNIAPQPIETALVYDPYIDQVCVIGDRRNYISSLIVPEFGMLKGYAAEKKIPFKDNAELVNKAEIRAFYESRVEKINQKFARYEQIKRFCLLAEPFSVEQGELTPTMKMKRRVIHEKYANEIESMYS